ncbi:hypothetical protein [Pacificimonas flava]|uniref:Uncharacterized protein n=1 Tax=Pacificimonas flava TaxID=1234595 RepID=M2U1F3_9SPHN|nr:hypothetical protein [Pacificimonas flava]EMD81822.1 hypothetical protein C725_2804 [Pacificimonas flava]MBB5281648.1 hypothetical protein [Pacificimonas flava]
MPEWTTVPLEYEAASGQSDVFVKAASPIDAASLSKTTPAPTARQAYFHEYLKRISWHLGSRSIPIFLDFNGDRRRMDKGCIGHAVAAGVLKPPVNGPDGISHVELVGSQT